MVREHTKHIEFTTGSQAQEQRYPRMRRLDISKCIGAWSEERRRADGFAKDYLVYTGSFSLVDRLSLPREGMEEGW